MKTCAAISPERKLLLTSFFNGDWAADEPVHWHLFEDGTVCSCGCFTEEEVREFMVNTVVSALLPGLVPLFQRHRWTGADVTVDELLVLLGIHGIYRRVVPIWLSCLRKKSNPKPEDFEQCSSSGPLELEDVHGADAVVDLDAAQNAPCPSLKEDWAAFNERMRTSAGKLAEGRAERPLFVLRKATAPAADIMKQYLHLSSDDWMRQNAAEFVQGKSPLKYKLNELASLSTTYASVVLELFEPETWDDMPRVWRTESLAALAFRSVSVGAGTSHMMLDSVYNGFPFTLFQLLEVLEMEEHVDVLSVAEAIVNAPWCMLDNFSGSFLDEYVGDDGGPEALLDPVALAVLEIAALSQNISIADIECRNAKLRRLKESQSGSHATTLQQLAARFSLSCHRVASAESCPPCDPTSRAPRRDKKPWKWLVGDEDCNRERKRPSWRLRKRLRLGLVRLTNGGGAWRAFLRLELTAPTCLQAPLCNLRHFRFGVAALFEVPPLAGGGGQALLAVAALQGCRPVLICSELHVEALEVCRCHRARWVAPHLCGFDKWLSNTGDCPLRKWISRCSLSCPHIIRLCSFNFGPSALLFSQWLQVATAYGASLWL
jgi:hypothetical protein